MSASAEDLFPQDEDMCPRAQGWYRDPYGIHEDRYFSSGWPTKLVRDCGIEAYDLPPDQPLPEGELTPVPPRRTAEQARRQRRSGQPAVPAVSLARAIFDYFDQLPHV